jgi:hypothetical protein
MLRRKRNNLTSGNCMYIEGRDRSYGTRAGRRDGRSGYDVLEGEQLDEWQLYVEGRERAYGVLGEEMVWLCCVGRGTA